MKYNNQFIDNKLVINLISGEYLDLDSDIEELVNDNLKMLSKADFNGQIDLRVSSTFNLTDQNIKRLREFEEDLNHTLKRHGNRSGSGHGLKIKFQFLDEEIPLELPKPAKSPKKRSKISKSRNEGPVCSQCFTPKSLGDLIEIKGHLICANCKAISLEKIKSGLPITSVHPYQNIIDSGVTPGIKGWLILVAILVTIIPLFLGFSLIGLINLILTTNSTTFGSYNGYIMLYLIIAFVQGLLLFISIFVALAFYTKNRYFPRLHNAFHSFCIVFLLPSFLFNMTAFILMVWSVLWVFYTLKSKRVKVTFVRTFGDPKPS